MKIFDEKGDRSAIVNFGQTSKVISNGSVSFSGLALIGSPGLKNQTMIASSGGVQSANMTISFWSCVKGEIIEND